MRHGHHPVSLLRELWTLRRGPGKLTSGEYFYYRLWEAEGAAKAAYVGRVAQHSMHLSCNDYAWHAVTQDKLLFHSAMLGADLPVPEILAVAHPSRRCAGAWALRTSSDGVNFLRDRHSYPFFGKPVSGVYSLGAVSATRYDTAEDRVVLHDGSTASVDEIATALCGLAEERSGQEMGMSRPGGRESILEAGFLVQRTLQPDRSLATLVGDRLCSVRMLLLLTAKGPVLSRAVCKIPSGQNVADNYWRSGNLIGAIDLGTGKIQRVVSGWGDEMVVNPRHPDTGADMVGAALQGWSKVVDLAMTAALTMPNVRTQSWDMALTSRGPVLLELNWGGDLNLAQLAYGRGMLDDEYREHLTQCGYDFA